eukprot:CAMPEP_0197198206 /NCGR_PEP_ID=MMETSP1423-20130617/33257_1 /TAXON_ID=476441 /ORGANISM="Pseudo-nitzschia heimii, Strain UNC1101" /LENGTH=711 /DNA_ID=CAMNT_0042652037 /DNA_START=175 /DNA_END=2310 /DNA_ORIENTATION=-
MTAKYLHTSSAGFRYGLEQDFCRTNVRIRSMTTATSSATANTKDEEDLSKFSAAELKQLAAKSLRLRQRQEESSMSAEHKAEKITQYILDMANQQKSGDEKSDDLPNLQTSLIDSWMTFQSSMIRDMKETAEQVASEEEDFQSQQRLDMKNLREVCSAAESMTRIVESMEDPSPHHYIAVLKAWANACKIAKRIGKAKAACVVGIPQRTQLILNNMGGKGNDANIDISVEAYNEVIKAWAYSAEHLRGTMAEQIFQKIQFPSGESLRLIMRAHAWGRESRSAHIATGHFMRMMRHLEAGRDDMEPSSIDDYHLLCDIWTEAGDKNSSSKVYNVLQIMKSAYEKGYTDICPDLQCYRDALITMSRRQNVEDVGYLADETLKEMKDQMIFPDAICYRSAILAWKHVVMSRDCENPEQGIRRTQELLKEMSEAYYRTTEILIQTTTEDYNHVLQAMSLSKNPQAVNYAQGLFSTLKNEISSTGGPDAQSYRHMLGILRNSRSPTKFSSASNLLQEFKKKYRTDDNWRASKTSEESTMAVFTEFVRVCGAPVSSSNMAMNDARQDRTKIMTTALKVLEESKKLGLTLHSDTYTALVEACDRLLPANSQERENALTNVFSRACEEGFVDQSLLETFRSTASTYLYAKLVVSKSIPMEDIKVVPGSWTRNIEGYREGKQVMPLSIHGNFTFTKSAADYRMRKLRRRTNQKFLRGGRL